MSYLGNASLYHKSKQEQYINGIGHFYFVKLKGKLRNPIEPDHEMLWEEPQCCADKMYLEHQAWAITKALKTKKNKGCSTKCAAN